MPTTASSAVGDPVQGFGHLGVWTVHGTGQVPRRGGRSPLSQLESVKAAARARCTARRSALVAVP